MKLIEMFGRCIYYYPRTVCVVISCRLAPWLRGNATMDVRRMTTRGLSSSAARPKNKLEFEVDTSVSQDVLLFRYENDRFFKILNTFGVSQFVFWSYLAHFAYTTLRDVSSKEAEETLVETLRAQGKEDVPALSWWRKINLGENKYRYGIATMCLSIGYIIVAGCSLYTRHTVKYLTLLKGGQFVKLTCYSPLWRPYSLSVPLEHLSSSAGRSHSNHLPLKVKNRWMYYLLDRSGIYTNTKLFDFTVGVKRSWSRKP